MKSCNGKLSGWSQKDILSKSTPSPSENSRLIHIRIPSVSAVTHLMLSRQIVQGVPKSKRPRCYFTTFKTKPNLNKFLAETLQNNQFWSLMQN